MITITFISGGYVGKAIYATDIKIDDTVVLPSAYLAASQVTIIGDNDQGQDSVEVTAQIPEWLLESKIMQHKAEQVEASNAVKERLLSLI